MLCFPNGQMWQNYQPPPSTVKQLSLFTFQEQCEHSFKEAMKLEAVNPLSPENIHVATVTRVKGQYIWLNLEGEMAAETLTGKR